MIIISRSSSKLGHVRSKPRSLGQILENLVYTLKGTVLIQSLASQATQVSDLGPLWPSRCKSLTEFYQISLKILPNLTDFSSQLMACMQPNISVITEDIDLKLRVVVHYQKGNSYQ